MWPPKKSNIERVAKAYKRGTKQVKQRTQFSGTFGQNPAMDARAKATGANLKPGDTYSFTGITSKRVPKGKGKPMGMTFGTDRGAKPGTKKVKRKKA